MKTLDLHGIFVAIATPYRRDEGAEDFDDLLELLPA